MAKYKVNIVFKDSDKSLNQIITEVLKIELQSKFYSIVPIKTNTNNTHYSRLKGVIIND